MHQAQQEMNGGMNGGAAGTKMKTQRLADLRNGGGGGPGSAPNSNSLA